MVFSGEFLYIFYAVLTTTEIHWHKIKLTEGIKKHLSLKI